MTARDSLSEAESAALNAIVNGPDPGHEPWSEVLKLERLGHQLLTLACLVAGGWLERWTVAKVDYVTLTPLGAARLSVRLEERWVGHQEFSHRDEVDPKTKKVIRRTVAIAVYDEEPSWAYSTVGPIDDHRPVRMPQQSRHCALGDRLAALLIDEGSSPEDAAILREEAARTEDGLVVLSNGEPLTMFGGIPVILDRRMRKA